MTRLASAVFYSLENFMSSTLPANLSTTVLTFVAMLDSVFIVPPVYDDSYYGYRIHEITEMQVAKWAIMLTATSLPST